MLKAEQSTALECECCGGPVLRFDAVDLSDLELMATFRALINTPGLFYHCYGCVCRMLAMTPKDPEPSARQLLEAWAADSRAAKSLQ